MYSLVVDNKVQDFKYKKTEFYLGDTFIGQIFKLNNSWSAVPWYKPSKIGVVHGFKTRYHASMYMLQYCEFIKG